MGFGFCEVGGCVGGHCECWWSIVRLGEDWLVVSSGVGIVMISFERAVLVSCRNAWMMRILLRDKGEGLIYYCYMYLCSSKGPPTQCVTSKSILPL